MSFTHVLTNNGGELVTEISSRRDISVFANPLHRFNGRDRWGLGLAPLPPGKTYERMLATGELSTEFLQAGGRADAMTVEIRRPGGREWGADWVRYTVGHPGGDEEPLDVAVEVAGGVKMIRRSEVFDADEATELFWSYYTTGAIPDSYALRPMEGYTADGAIIDLQDGSRLSRPTD